MVLEDTMPAAPAGEVLQCVRCHHGHDRHRPACGDGLELADPCGCPGFQWVDPAPSLDRHGYHRAEQLHLPH